MIALLKRLTPPDKRGRFDDLLRAIDGNPTTEMDHAIFALATGVRQSYVARRRCSSAPLPVSAFESTSLLSAHRPGDLALFESMDDDALANMFRSVRRTHCARLRWRLAERSFAEGHALERRLATPIDRLHAELRSARVRRALSAAAARVVTRRGSVGEVDVNMPRFVENPASTIATVKSMLHVDAQRHVCICISSGAVSDLLSISPLVHSRRPSPSAVVALPSSLSPTASPTLRAARREATAAPRRGS